MDVWDVHKPTLLSLGIDPIIGNVSNRGLLPDESTVTCCVKAQLFPNPESYRLTISSDRVTILLLLLLCHLTNFHRLISR